MKYKLFVYGTLKKGLSNHHFLKKAKFLSKAFTKRAYPLIVANKPYPYLIDKAGEGFSVEGELYLVDLKTLKNIDRLEEYPTYYDRKIIDVVDENSNTHKAFCYFLKKEIPYKNFRFLKSFK